MWPDWVSNPGPLTDESYKSDALPTALRGSAGLILEMTSVRTAVTVTLVVS